MYGQQSFYQPMSNAQQRLQALENQYPQFANPMGYVQQPPQYTQQQTSMSAPIIRGRPVANEEEANAAMIDFDGSLFVFPDKNHGKIYTKQLGLDGNIIFLKYTLEQKPQEAPVAPVQEPSVEYAKQADLDAAFSSLADRLEELEKRIPVSKQNKGGINHE